MPNPYIEPLEARIAPAVLSIAGPVSVSEGDNGQKDLNFTVLLDVVSPTALTVKVNTMDGSASVVDGDYLALTDFIVSIPANTISKTFSVKVNGDTKFEPDETFSVVLSAPSAGHTLGAATGAGTILADADPVPKLSVRAASVTEGNTGTKLMNFRVSLTNAASDAITFQWLTQDAAVVPMATQAATAGVDYAAVAGEFGTIPAGATFVDIPVTVFGDRVKAGDDLNEVFEVVLSNAMLGATTLEITTGSAVGTILNDEPTITVEFAAGQGAMQSEGSNGIPTTVNFIVKLSVAAPENIDVFVSTLAGSAMAGSDFTGLDNQFFRIVAGQTQVAVPVSVFADTLFEDNETFSLQLVGATMSGATIDYSATPHGVTIVNDENVPTISIKAATTVEPAAGSKAMNFAVKLSGALDRDVTFTWSTTELSATAADFTPVVNRSATIPAGQTSVLLPVAILSDSVSESNEQFRVDIAAPTFGSIATSSATGTIRATPLEISVLAPQAAVTEGTGGADREALFRISRGSTDLSTAVTVRVSTVDGTATAAGGDYDALQNLVLTIPAGISEIVVPVAVNPDNRHEADESFSLQIDSLEIAGADFDGITVATAAATILNDDDVPTISVGSATVVERSTGLAILSFAVTLSNAADTDITVGFVTELDSSPLANTDAASREDFTAVTISQTITIPAGQTSVSTHIEILGDTVQEKSESFLVRISNPTSGTIVADSARMTITDDEPVISLSAPAPVVEGNAVGGTTNAIFTINLDKAASENIAVRVVTRGGGTATPGVDFDLVGFTSEKWVLILAGARTGTFTVPVHADVISEKAETFTAQVDTVKVGVNAALDANGLPVGGVALPQAFLAEAVATIIDDDAISLAINDASIVEGNSGSKQLTFTVSLPKAADRDVTFHYSTMDGTALAGADFLGASGNPYVIAAGSMSATIMLSIYGDTLGEADEIFSVILSDATVGFEPLTIADAVGVGTIFNDEHTVTITPAVSVAENTAGGRALVSVFLSSPAAFPVDVVFALTNGTATKGTDFNEPVSLRVTIPAGQTSAMISVPVTNDVSFEGNETFEVALTTATNAELAAAVVCTVTILNDDQQSSLSVSDVTVAEGNGAGFTDMTFTATLNRASGTDVSFDWETLTGGAFTATPGTDFTAAASTTLTILAGTLSKTFVVKVQQDIIHESNETLGVSVSNVVGASLTSPDTVGGSVKTLTGTITNDEAVPTISIADLKLLETFAGTANAVFTVTLSGASDRDVTFLWRTASGGVIPATDGVDYVGVATGTLVTILAGATSTTLTVAVSGDGDAEADETFLVQIVDPRFVAVGAPHVIGAGALITGGDFEAVGTIRNDDTTAMISAGSAAISTTEGDGLVEVHIPVTLSNPVPAGQTATVGFEVIAGTGTGGATAGMDYEVPASAVIVFAAGEVTKDIVVRVKPDAISELSEMFSVRLRDVTSQNVVVEAGVNDTSMVTIFDNDAVPEISVANIGASENEGTMTFVIKLNRAASTPVTVKAETVDGTAISGLVDFTGRSLTMFTFAPGETTKTYAVSIRNDGVAEGLEHFLVRLSDPTNGVFPGGALTFDGQGTIADPDLGSLRIASISRAEGSVAGTPAVMTFAVTRDGSTAHEISANYTITFDALLAAGVTSAQAADIVSGLTGTVTIPIGQRNATISVSLAGDTIAEGDEAFRITLCNIVNGFAAADTDLTATGTIQEDDVLVRFQGPAVVSQVEGQSGTSNMAFAFELNQVSTTDVTVTFAVIAGSATNTDFMVPTVLTVTIPAGQTTGAFAVSILGDATAEAAETFTVRMASAVGAIVDGVEHTRTGEILNDDAVFRVLDGARVVEGNAGTRNLVFEVELADASFTVGGQYTVDFATANALAVAGVDYTAASGTLTFTANGKQTVSVLVSGDTAVENDETLTLIISNAKLNGTNVVAIIDNDAIGTIQDDEVSVSIGNATVTEGDVGQQQMIFVVSMLAAAPYPVTIHFITVDGTALGAAPGVTDTTGRDFRAVTAGTLTIPAGQSAGQISISVFGDLVDESGGEAFKVRLTSINGGVLSVSEGVGTIAEDADPLPTLSIADAQVLETDAGSPVMKFRVSLSAAADEAVTFRWGTSAGTAAVGDFISQSNVLATIPVGALFVDVEVAIVADTLVEGNEKFVLTISDGLRGGTSLVISDATADGKILDDDATLLVALADDAVSFAEGAGKARVRLDAPSVPGEFTVTFTLTDPTLSTDVPAHAGADFTVPTSLTKTFPAGTQAADLFLEIDLVGDSVDEWDERFVVTLVSATGVKLGTDADDLKSVVTIVDDDAAPTIQFADIVVSESSGTAGFVVTLVGNPTERSVTIQWDTVADTALAGSDFTGRANQTLTIPAGSRNGGITVVVLNDSLDEKDERFRVALTAANFSENGITEALGYMADQVAIATIPQNDVRSASVSGGSVVEGAAGTSASKVKFTIHLDAAPSATPVKVNYGTLAGTAFAGADFIATSGRVIFQPGETAKDVLVDVVSDDVAELDETFKLNISIPADGFAVLGGTAEAVGTIEADESVFRLERVLSGGEDSEVTEGARARFRVVRTGAIGLPATVFYSLAEDATAGALRAIVGTDFVAQTGSISFAAGESSSSDFGRFIDAVTMNDRVAELNGEKFLLRLTNVTNGVVSGVAGEAEKTIVINDDDVPADPKVRIENAVVNEGGSLSFVVRLVPATLGLPLGAPYPIRVSFQSVLGVPASGVASADDFAPGFSTIIQTVTFGVGEQTVTITVPTSQDATAEVNETMTLRLIKVEKDFGGLVEIAVPFLAANSSTPLATVDATGTIQNDDTVITVNSVSQPEGGGLSDMTFVATIPSAAPFPVSFHYKTQNGTATLGDYTAAEGDVTIPVGQTQATFTVQVKGDGVREGNEQFSIALTAPMDATLAVSSVTGTIENDDAGPELTVSGGTVAEPGAGAGIDLVFTVSLSGEITESVTVKFATADGTAQFSGVIKDYVEQHGVITFVPQAGVLLQTREIRVVVNGDDWKEGDETMGVALFDPTGEAEFVVASATGTILDGADSLIGVFVRDASAVEGGGVVFTLEATSLPAQAFSVNVNTRAGSADSSDFTPLVNRAVTFSTLSRTASVTVPTVNDSTFEASERFYLDVSYAGNVAGIVPTGGTAEGMIYNDDFHIISKREFEFIDEDGDLVNVKVSKGALLVANGFGALQSRGIVTLARAGGVGGYSLDSVNFLGTGREFEGANLFITRKSQQGFDRATDGRVNVGEVVAAQPGFAVLAQGVNLGTVKIDGDLGRIIAGSNIRSVGVAKLEVGSLGVVDRSGDEAVQSILFGKTGSILVHGDVEGSLYSVGTNRGNGSIGSLTIAGKLLGGNSESSGYISSSSSIGKITIGGIIGGPGVGSGRVQVLGDVKALSVGSIQGGDATDSGSVRVNGRVSTVRIGDIFGAGDGGVSGVSVFRAGSLVAGRLGDVTITGGIKTSADADHIASGSIISGGSIDSLMVGGSAEGTVDRALVISAANRIGKINVGTLKFAEILAGYAASDTQRGTVRNADAQIGAVVIGDFIGSSIVAGAAAGGDELFGQANDFVPAASASVLNKARVISKIASLTIQRLMTDGVATPTGIVAEQIGRVKVAGTNIGFGSDPVLIGASQVAINVI